jgi:3-carboxy-cis,cis-muconate cycloisomerase
MGSMRFTDSRVPTHGVHGLLDGRARWQRYLDVEGALALVEADLGVIPAEAGPAIAAAARLSRLDVGRVEAEVARTSHPLMALLVELDRVVGEPHGGWVHWGATTQNVTQTGDVLALRDVHAVLRGLLLDVLTVSGQLAERGADMVMAGRTHGQQAVPITFGFKVAAWIDQLLRHLDRLDEVADRLFVAMLGGAAGTFAALGSQGPAVQDALAARLGLGSMLVPSRTIADPQAELVSVLALISATGGSIAKELITLSEVEFGEVEEPAPAGVVGSSTMPQKRNPQLCMDVVTISAQVRACVPLALEGMLHSHEADGAYTAMTDDAVRRACILTADMLARLHLVLGGLHLDADRMLANLSLTGGLINSESVMLEIGRKLGRQKAHEIVHDAAALARSSGRSFSDVLAEDPRIREHLDEHQISRLLDPTTHTGRSSDLARAAADRVKDHTVESRRGA